MSCLAARYVWQIQQHRRRPGGLRFDPRLVSDCMIRFLVHVYPMKSAYARVLRRAVGATEVLFVPLER